MSPGRTPTPRPGARSGAFARICCAWALVGATQAGAATVALFLPAEKAPPGGEARAFCGLLPLVSSTQAPGVIDAAMFQGIAAAVFGTATGGHCDGSAGRESLFRSDAELLTAQVHLARERGIEPQACDAAAWQVVAAVFDRCAEPPHGPRTPACTAQLRLVAQPVVSTPVGWVSRDDTLHFVYDVAAPAAFERDRDRLRSAPRAQDGAPCSVDGAAEARAAVRRHADSRQLGRVAWSASSRSGQHWTFGTLVRTDDGRDWRLEALPAGGYFDNFSKPEMLRGTCGANREVRSSAAGALGCRDAPAALAAELDRLRNPARALRNERACVACHMADQMQLQLREGASVVDTRGISIFARSGVKLGNQRQAGFRADGVFWFGTYMRRTFDAE